VKTCTKGLESYSIWRFFVIFKVHYMSGPVRLNIENRWKRFYHCPRLIFFMMYSVHEDRLGLKYQDFWIQCENDHWNHSCIVYDMFHQHILVCFQVHKMWILVNFPQIPSAVISLEKLCLNLSTFSNKSFFRHSDTFSFETWKLMGKYSFKPYYRKHNKYAI
jgi:hypothetical protein